ncbi:MAG: lysostaphin resistance A-like protein [Planctomycetota bacterium]
MDPKNSGLRRLVALVRLEPFAGPLNDLFLFRRVWRIPGSVQIVVVTGLFVATVLLTHAEYVAKGTCFGFPGPAFNVLINPIYEELIFRGWILGALACRRSSATAIAVSSLLFGLVHIRNIYWIETPQLFQMMGYSGLVLGPLFGYITLRTRSVWPAVMLHYLNNLMYFVKN